MIDIPELLNFVNSQIAFHNGQAIRYATKIPNPRRKELHTQTGEKFERLLEYINAQESKPKSATTSAPQNLSGLSLNWEEIKGLPQELIDELSISDGDKAEFTLISIMNELGGPASLDRLLVEFYKRTGEIMKRTPLNNKLYRMAQKGSIFSAPGRRGIYSAFPLEEDESFSGKDN